MSWSTFPPRFGLAANRWGLKSSSSLIADRTWLQAWDGINTFLTVVPGDIGGITGIQLFDINTPDTLSHYGDIRNTSSAIQFTSGVIGAATTLPFTWVFGATQKMSLDNTGLLTLTGPLTVTGTFTLTGDFNQTGNYNITGNEVLTGNLTLASSGASRSISLGSPTANWISWATAGLGAPTLVSQSIGAKLVLYPNAGVGVADYAIGIEANNMWFGCPNSATGFRWYGGTTLYVTLSNGNLALPTAAATITIGDGTGNASLQITGVPASSGNTNGPFIQLQGNGVGEFYIGTPRSAGAGAGVAGGALYVYGANVMQFYTNGAKRGQFDGAGAFRAYVNLIADSCDLYSYRAGGATGVCFLRSDGSAYLYCDATTYQLPAYHLTVASRLGVGFVGTVPITNLDVKTVANSHLVSATATIDSVLNQTYIGAASDNFGAWQVLGLGSGGMKPLSHNAVALGSSTAGFLAVYAAAFTSTSDAREKTAIKDAPGLSFINRLHPVQFMWRNGGNTVSRIPDGFDAVPESETIDGEKIPAHQTPRYKDLVTPRTGARQHLGLLAQEVKTAADAEGFDFAAWKLSDPNDPNSAQTLDYMQFVAPLIKAVQELTARIAVLEKRP